MALEALDIGKDPVPDPGIRRSKVQLGKLLLSYPFYILMDRQSDASSNYLHPMALQSIVDATVDEFRFAEIFLWRDVQVQLLLPFPFQRLFNGFSPPVLLIFRFHLAYLQIHLVELVLMHIWFLYLVYLI